MYIIFHHHNYYIVRPPCRSDKVEVLTGKEVTLEYRRMVGVMHGGYMCTLTAHTPPASRVISLSCNHCGVTAAMAKENNPMVYMQRVEGGTDAGKVSLQIYIVVLSPFILFSICQ